MNFNHLKTYLILSPFLALSSHSFALDASSPNISPIKHYTEASVVQPFASHNQSLNMSGWSFNKDERSFQEVQQAPLDSQQDLSSFVSEDSERSVADSLISQELSESFKNLSFGPQENSFEIYQDEAALSKNEAEIIFDDDQQAKKLHVKVRNLTQADELDQLIDIIDALSSIEISLSSHFGDKELTSLVKHPLSAKITELWLKDSCITNLNTLGHLPNLQIIGIQGGKINQIRPLIKLPKLHSVILVDTLITKDEIIKLVANNRKTFESRNPKINFFHH